MARWFSEEYAFSEVRRGTSATSVPWFMGQGAGGDAFAALNSGSCEFKPEDRRAAGLPHPTVLQRE